MYLILWNLIKEVLEDLDVDSKKVNQEELCDTLTKAVTTTIAEIMTTDFQQWLDDRQ